MSLPLPLLLQAIRSSDDERGGISRSHARANLFLERESTESAPDSGTVDRIRAGDEPTFLALYRHYYSSLCDFAIAYTRDPALAEDLVSDLFLHIWQTRATLHVTGTLRAYLFSAVRYRALNAQRNERRHASHHSQAAAAGEPLGAGLMDTPDALLQHAPSPELTVWTAIDALPERARLVMTLRWKSELSLAEIANVLGTSEMAVRQVHKRALAELRKRLAGLVDEGE